jgi:negative regulator of sigma E activity
MANDDRRESAEMNEQSCLVAAALADGETVDPEALKIALNDPAVREYLVDLITLRQSVGVMTEHTAVHWRERRSVLSRVGWMAAAAAVIISLTAGYVAGQRAVQVAPAPSVETVVDFSGSASAPKPTRVVPLRPGVNWTEKVEGQ